MNLETLTSEKSVHHNQPTIEATIKSVSFDAETGISTITAVREDTGEQLVIKLRT